VLSALTDVESLVALVESIQHLVESVVVVSVVADPPQDAKNVTTAIAKITFFIVLLFLF